jgi:ribose/xylose/arabinose/galactoside ABC-type transport system permease subunit
VTPAARVSALVHRFSQQGVLRTVFAERPVFLLLLLVIVVGVNAVLVPDFFTINNLLGSTAYAVEIGLLALGQSLVIISGAGAIDLSVGSMVSLASMFFGLVVVRGHINLWVGVFLAVAFGLGLGAINGFMVTVARFPALIVTLATLYAFGSIPLVLTSTVPISNLPDELFTITSFLGPLPIQVLVVFIPVIAILWFLTRLTVGGRYLYGVGTNGLAARFAAVPVGWTRFWAFAASGALAGLTAVVTTSRFASARPDAGAGLELQSITIAILGGVSIMGGSGTVAGVVMATLLITLVNNGLNVANVQATWQLGALGAVLIGSAVLNQFVQRRFGTS